MSGTLHNKREPLDIDKLNSLVEENKNVQYCFELFD